MNVSSLQLQHKNIFGMHFPLCLNQIQKKTCLCKEAVPVVWKQQYADRALCYTVKRLLQLVPVHPHQFGVLWYGSFTQIERLLYTLSVSMETATWDAVSYAINDIYLPVSQCFFVDKTACAMHGPKHRYKRHGHACSNTQKHTHTHTLHPLSVCFTECYSDLVQQCSLVLSYFRGGAVNNILATCLTFRTLFSLYCKGRPARIVEQNKRSEKKKAFLSVGHQVNSFDNWTEEKRHFFCLWWENCFAFEKNPFAYILPCK